MMHLKTLLLLAVHSSVITAAVLRRDRVTRSFNQSTIDDAAVQPMITDAPTLSLPAAPLPITTKQIGSVPAVGSGAGAAKIDEEDIVSANTEPPEPLNTSKQVGIVPAVGSGPGAATLPAAEAASANTEPPVLSSTAFPSATSSSSPPARDGDGDDSVVTASKQIGIVPAVGSGPGAATLPAANVASANTEPPEPFSTTTTVPSTTSLSFLRRSQVSSDVLASRPSSSQPADPTNTDAPAASNNNAALAQTFNQFFDTMNSDSTCNPGIEAQRMVCIDKKTAQCGANGKYTLSACSQNEICRAVPLDGNQRGIAVKCVPASGTSPSSSSESAALSQTVVSAVSPSSSPEGGLPTIIFTTRTIIVTPVPKTTVQAEPTLSNSVLSSFFSKFTSLENGLSTSSAPKPTLTKSVVPDFFSKFTSIANGLSTTSAPEPTPTKSVVPDFFSKLTSLAGSSPTPSSFVTVAKPTSSDVAPPSAPPQETPSSSPTTSEQPAIVIEPQPRKETESTKCPQGILDPSGAGGAENCFVIHG